jgi:hypothetical protein
MGKRVLISAGWYKADGEGDVVFNEKFHPLGTDELAIRQQRLNGGRPEQAQIPFHQRDPLRGGGIACVVQQHPHQRHSKPSRDNGQN